MSKMQDIIGWDIVNWSVGLKYWEQNTTLDLSNCFGLEIGSEYGGLSLWLALKGSRVIYSNISDHTGKNGVFIHKKHKVSQLIEYGKVDATNIQYNSFFDVIMSKSVLGGIRSKNEKDIQRKVIEQIHKALKPGGEYLFAENLLGSPMHKYLRKIFRKGLSRNWHYLTIEETKDLLSIFSQFNYLAVGFLGAIGKMHGQRIFQGIIDKLFLNDLLPEDYKYILIGIAKK